MGCCRSKPKVFETEDECMIGGNQLGNNESLVRNWQPESIRYVYKTGPFPGDDSYRTGSFTWTNSALDEMPYWDFSKSYKCVPGWNIDPSTSRIMYLIYLDERSGRLLLKKFESGPRIARVPGPSCFGRILKGTYKNQDHYIAAIFSKVNSIKDIDFAVRFLREGGPSEFRSLGSRFDNDPLDVLNVEPVDLFESLKKRFYLPEGDTQ